MNNIDFKNIIIGCLIMTCIFLFMGQSNQTGRFDKIYANEIELSNNEFTNIIKPDNIELEGNKENRQTSIYSGFIITSNEDNNSYSYISDLAFIIGNLQSPDFSELYVTIGVDDYQDGFINIFDRNFNSKFQK